jgi:Bacteriophage tail sheath protein
MPEYLAPGVYIEELPAQSHSIQGVSTSTAGFIGVAQQAAPVAVITSVAEFERVVGNSASEKLTIAVEGFFKNGGTRCSVARIAPADALQAGLDALATEDISILCCPDEHRFPNAAAVMAAHCEQRKDRVCILQSPQPVMPAASHDVPVHSSYATYYYPWLTVVGLDGVTNVTVPPGGHVAGVYAQMDSQRGVWVPPAGVPLVGVTGLSQQIGSAESELVSSRGINLLRVLPGKGIQIWGARTTSPDSDWKYINIRRLAVFIEHSLSQGLQWAVFEPNGPALWAAVRLSIEDFLRNLWKSGGLKGPKQEEAFFVRCDNTTMTQSDIDVGRFVVIVGFAPVRPAEFVILRITGQTNCA